MNIVEGDIPVAIYKSACAHICVQELRAGGYIVSRYHRRKDDNSVSICDPAEMLYPRVVAIDVIGSEVRRCLFAVPDVIDDLVAFYKDIDERRCFVNSEVSPLKIYRREGAAIAVNVWRMSGAELVVKITPNFPSRKLLLAYMPRMPEMAYHFSATISPDDGEFGRSIMEWLQLAKDWVPPMPEPKRKRSKP